jgi:hypothetical protein
MEAGRKLDVAVARALGGWAVLKFSTDPAAAALLRAEMARRGWHWDLMHTDDPFTPDKPHLCRFWLRDDYGDWSDAPTETEATARAALAALTSGRGE